MTEVAQVMLKRWGDYAGYTAARSRRAFDGGHRRLIVGLARMQGACPANTADCQYWALVAQQNPPHVRRVTLAALAPNY